MLAAFAIALLCCAAGPASAAEKVVRRFSATPDLHKCDGATWGAAARSGNMLDLRACVLGGTDVNKKDEVGCTAAHAAATNMHLDALFFLHEKGADMDFKCTATRKSPLMYSASVGHLDAVKFLVEAGADATYELVDHTGTSTAASMAAHAGHIPTVLYLHKLESAFHPKDRQAWTGSWLSWAAASGEADMTEQLAEGKEPGGTTLEAKDAHGFTAAHWAAQMGNLDALKVLVAKGADLTSTSHTGLTLLMSAAFWGRNAVVEYLIAAGVHADQHDAASWTALMWAAANGQVGTMKALLDAGASVQVQGGDWDALMVAAATGNADAATVLLEAGANTWSTNAHGKSAADIARAAGFAELAAVIASGHDEF